jgi:Peptidase propeptide and YPEB domain
MHRHLAATAIAAVLGCSAFGPATPALADSGSGASLQRALFVARDFGFVGFSEIQYYDGKWELDGRDLRGKSIHIDVDALSGAVSNVNRFN